MLVKPIDVIRFLRAPGDGNEFHLADGQYFVSDGENSKEVTNKDISVYYLNYLYKNDAPYRKAYDLLKELTAIWGVSIEWLAERTFRGNRAVMRRVFWLIAKRRFKVSNQKLAVMVGVADASTVVSGLRNVKKWVSVSDPSVMRYYTPVAHLIKEKADICKKEAV